MDLEQWAENHKQRAQLEETLHAIRRMWNASGMGKTRLMEGPYYAVVGADLGKDEGTRSFILPGKVQQKQQEQNQDGSEGTAEVHDAKPG